MKFIKEVIEFFTGLFSGDEDSKSNKPNPAGNVARKYGEDLFPYIDFDQDIWNIKRSSKYNNALTLIHEETHVNQAKRMKCVRKADNKYPHVWMAYNKNELVFTIDGKDYIINHFDMPTDGQFYHSFNKMKERPEDYIKEYQVLIDCYNTPDSVITSKGLSGMLCEYQAYLNELEVARRIQVDGHNVLRELKMCAAALRFLSTLITDYLLASYNTDLYDELATHIEVYSKLSRKGIELLKNKD